MKFSNINPKYKKNLWKGIVILLITALINLTEIKGLFNWALAVDNVNIDVADFLIDLICDILFAIGTAFIISYYTC